MVGARSGRRASPGRSAGVEARARAADRPPLARRRRRPSRRGVLHARRAWASGAGRGAWGVSAGEWSGAPPGPPRRILRFAFDQPLANAHQPRSRQDRRWAGLRPRCSPGPARGRSRPGRETAVHAVFPRLTGAWELLPCPGCPIGRCRTVPVPRHWSAHRTQPDTTKVFRSFPGPSARVGGFFTQIAATVFENSAAF